MGTKLTDLNEDEPQNIKVRVSVSAGKFLAAFVHAYQNGTQVHHAFRLWNVDGYRLIGRESVEFDLTFVAWLNPKLELRKKP